MKRKFCRCCGRLAEKESSLDRYWRQRWFLEEDALLLFYRSMGYPEREIGEVIGRKRVAMRSRRQVLLRRLGAKPVGRRAIKDLEFGQELMLREGLRNGLGVLDLAEQCRVATRTIRRWIKKLRLKPPEKRAPPWPAARIAELKRLMAKHHSQAKAAALMGLKRNQVLGQWYKLKQRGEVRP